MKRHLMFMGLLSFSAHAFVCEPPPTHPVLQASDVDMLADVTALDTPETKAAKKAYEQAVREVVGSGRITDFPTESQENSIHQAVIDYKGPATLEGISAYVKSLSSDIIVKSYVMTKLADGQRADCFELNDVPYRESLRYVMVECKEDKNSRRLFPNTIEILPTAGPREVCSSMGGARAGCRPGGSSSCSPSWCR